MNSKLTPITIALLGALHSMQSFAETSLNDITIGADLFETTQQDMPASVEVLTQDELQDQGANHFDDVLLKTPNVNFSGETSRARHIQIRGLGERDEYTGAPNSSVGFAVDDIDFSGIGMTAGLFDIKQVEVLNGPQNTRYGQSAIGGLINIQSNDPTSYRESMIEASAGDDSLREFGLMTSGPINNEKDAAQYRFVMFKHQSDGFRHNETLGRSDTNGKDELTLRGKLRLFPNQHTTVDITALHADLNNGYDMWSTNNTYTVYSNKPGKDAQLSNAAAVKVAYTGNESFVFTSKTSLANSDMLKSYDYDWTASGTTIDDVYSNQKNRKTISQELRWHSTEQSKINNNTDWLIGLYGSHLNEENNTYNYGASWTKFELNKIATFGQLDIAINSKTTVTTGLRLEHNSSSFDNGTNQFSPDENLWGANIAYSYKYNDIHTAYTSLTKGYKAGGFNADLANTANDSFDAESLYNYEIGLKSNYGTNLKTAVVAFYMDRYNAQFDGYTAPSNPALPAWKFYTENFDRAHNYGLEANFFWQANPNFDLYGSAGLINTDVEGTPSSSYYVISGREQAHAPRYQLNVGAKYRHNRYYAQTDITAVDAFFYDNVHNFRSTPYTLVNARIGYEANDYEVYLWAKNLTDEKYSVRGFQFDLDWDGNDDQFEGLGSPRQIGLTARVYF